MSVMNKNPLYDGSAKKTSRCGMTVSAIGPVTSLEKSAFVKSSSYPPIACNRARVHANSKRKLEPEFQFFANYGKRGQQVIKIPRLVQNKHIRVHPGGAALSFVH